MKSFFLHKHRRKVIAVIISSVIFTVICRHVYLSNASASSALQDLDLLGKFCTQRENWKSYQPLPPLDSRKQPQWVPGHAALDSAYMTERDHTSHLYQDAARPDVFMDEDVWDGLPVKGTFYMIVKNEELQSARSAIRSIEDRFNAHNNVSYPWVLLNSQQYTHDFKKYIRKVASGKVYFGQIDLEAFTFPEWIDIKRTENAIRRMIYLRVKKSYSLYERQEMRYVKYERCTMNIHIHCHYIPDTRLACFNIILYSIRSIMLGVWSLDPNIRAICFKETIHSKQ